MVSREMAQRYLDFDIKAFVESHPTIRWCPHADCHRAVRLTTHPDNSSESSQPTTVHCGNEHYFCWCVCVCLLKEVLVCVCVCVCVCVHVCVWMWLWMCVCVCGGGGVGWLSAGVGVYVHVCGAVLHVHVYTYTCIASVCVLYMYLYMCTWKCTGTVQGILTCPWPVKTGRSGWTIFGRWPRRLGRRQPPSWTTQPVRDGSQRAANHAPSAGVHMQTHNPYMYIYCRAVNFCK